MSHWPRRRFVRAAWVGATAAAAGAGPAPLTGCALQTAPPLRIAAPVFARCESRTLARSRGALPPGPVRPVDSPDLPDRARNRDRFANDAAHLTRMATEPGTAMERTGPLAGQDRAAADRFDGRHL